MIVSVILIISAFHVVELNHVGLKYNKNFFELTDEIDKNGRHLSGIGNKYIEYPTTISTMEFSSANETANLGSAACWTANGQNVYLELSFFYRLVDETNLKSFYLEYEDNWKGYFARLAITKIKEVSTQFVTLYFFTDRLAISEKMKVELDNIFKLRSNGVLSVTDF